MTGSAMQYLEIIGSYLPGLPVESAWQLLQEIDSLYLALAGEQGYQRDKNCMFEYGRMNAKSSYLLHG